MKQNTHGKLLSDDNVLLMEKCFYYPNYAALKLIATNLNKMSGINTRMFMKLLYSENNVDTFKA